MNLHKLLDFDYPADGDELLEVALKQGADVHAALGPLAETPLHVATRRRRERACQLLLDFGADINARTKGGKTPYAHAARRRFHEHVALFERRGADTTLNAADQFAVEVVNGRLNAARQILEANPGVARTGNPEEDRLLADVAGRNPTEPVEFLISAGADLSATGLDGGTALHQAAWFGQPANARLLIDAGAPLDVFDPVHFSSPLGWAIHGSRYSGAADERQDPYVELAGMLLEADSSLAYPDNPDDGSYFKRLLEDASPAVRKVLESSTQL